MEICAELIDKNAKFPTMATSGSVGSDIYAIEDVDILAGERKALRTGLILHIGKGYYGQIASRSGLAFKHGIITGAGIIDSDYRQEIFVLLINTSKENYKIYKGDRIAQIIILKYEKPLWTNVSKEKYNEGRSGGLGSTGR